MNQNQTEFITKRAQAHAAAVAGIASDPLVQAALAMRAADMQVKAAFAARRAACNRKDDAPATERGVEPASRIGFRRQAG
jgi:hypothetical protein